MNPTAICKPRISSFAGLMCALFILAALPASGFFAHSAVQIELTPLTTRSIENGPLFHSISSEAEQVTGFFGNQTEESGLVYMRARFYNPLIRHFVNIDPAQEGWTERGSAKMVRAPPAPEGLSHWVPSGQWRNNWYAYAAGNPLGFVDPTGLGNASILDAVQTGLSFLGMAPVVGFVFDVANAGISAARGNYADAAINLAAAVPGFGQAVTGAKFAAAGVGVFGAIRTADRLGDVGRAARNTQQLSLPAPRGLSSEGGHIRSFAQQTDQVYYRVSSSGGTGGWLTATPPRSSAWAQEALSLPPGNTATTIQRVTVPAGTRLQRSRATPVPEWGRFRGGAEQFRLLDDLPASNFGSGVPLP